jgi:hypothetical protein
MSPILDSIGSVKGFGWGAFSQTATFESIASVTVSSAQSSVEFTSIPSTYKHLQIRGVARTTRAVSLNGFIYQFNSDTAANYTSHLLRGDGSIVSVGNTVNDVASDFIVVAANNAGSNNMGAFIIDILDYTNTNKYKTTRNLFGVDNNGNGYVGITSTLWKSTSAITSIKLYSDSAANTAQYTSLGLYGIRGA